MRIRPCELGDANAFIAKHHRHHKPVVGHRFSIAAVKDDEIVGVAIIGRPVARKTNQRTIVEVTRLCTDGTKNACSLLYAAAARIAREIGYESIQTFTLESDPGTCRVVETAGQISRWKGNRNGKRRYDPHPRPEAEPDR